MVGEHQMDSAAVLPDPDVLTLPFPPGHHFAVGCSAAADASDRDDHSPPGGNHPIDKNPTGTVLKNTVLRCRRFDIGQNVVES